MEFDEQNSHKSVECQRLMAVSLGKITQSRGQRGGINLHKNLLVTGVLLKARNIFMMENYDAILQARREHMEAMERPEEVLEEPVEGAPAVAGTEPTTHDEEIPSADRPGSVSTKPDIQPSRPACRFQNKENSPPKDSYAQVMEPPVQPEPVEEQEEKKSYLELKPVRQLQSQNCQRCTKRRLTETEQAVESILPKKVKIESEASEFVEEPISFSVNTQTEPMQYETSQISSLVNRFSAGFAGLLSGVKIQQESTTLISSQQSSSTGQGHSSAVDSLISCSTQIKESLETLARPIIALTV